MKMLLLCTLLLVTGCAGINGGPNMSVDQLKAIASDKNASVVCSTIMGPWGTGKVVVVNMDQKVIDNGGVNVDANCLVGITNVKAAPAPKPVVTPAADPSKVPQ